MTSKQWNDISFRFVKLPNGIKFVNFMGTMQNAVASDATYWCKLLDNAPSGFEPTTSTSIIYNSAENGVVEIQARTNKDNQFIWLNRKDFAYNQRLVGEMLYL